MTLAERIASEIMDTIERERRINKDDLVAAAERVLQQDGMAQQQRIAAAYMRAAEVLDAAPVPRRVWSDYSQAFVQVEKFEVSGKGGGGSGEDAIVEILPSYFRPKTPPTRFGTPQK